MSNKCKNCKEWVLERKTIYGDGTEVVNFKAPDGKGLCSVLDLNTTPEFGCLSFKNGNHIKVQRKSLSPWQYWSWGVCPECNGRGSQPYPNQRHCDRCVGTGRVRYYDDGYIANEKNRSHPKEKESVCEEMTGTTLLQTSQPKEGLM